MGERRITCVECGSDFLLAVVQASEGHCPGCQAQRFYAPVRYVGDVAELASLGVVEFESHLCLTWARIALDAAVRAAVAAEGRDADVEFGESLLACTSAAHAVDAFYGGFYRLVPRPSQLGADSPRNAVVLETARAAFNIGPLTRSVAAELKWLYRLRDNAVHFGETTEGVAQHPSGVLTTATAVQWSWPSAERAVGLVLMFMDKCAATPRHGGELTAWTRSVGPVLAAFSEEWAARYE